MKHHWNSGTGNINPHAGDEHHAEIFRTVRRQPPHQCSEVTISLRRLSDGKESNIILIARFDPSERLELGEVPQSICELFKDFEVSSPDELVGKKVIGIYIGALLVGFKKAEG